MKPKIKFRLNLNRRLGIRIPGFEAALPSNSYFRLTIVAIAATAVISVSLLNADKQSPNETKMNTATNTDNFELLNLAPENRTFLNCSILSPKGFRLASLPHDEIDWNNPKLFLPVGIAISEIGPAVVSVGARPAYSDGTVSQWLEYLCAEEGYQHSPVRAFETNGLQGVICDATQQGDGVEMRMQLALIEDGGRLFQLAVMAPTELWSAFEDRFATSLASFSLAEKQGQQAARFVNDTRSEDSSKPEQASARLSPEEWLELALADDPGSLDPEHPINVNIRNRGAGLTPRILRVDTASKTAWIGLGAIESVARVPFGWHALDDGRRALIFDAEGRIQINMDYRTMQGQEPADLAKSYASELLRGQPHLEITSFETDGVSASYVRDANLDGEILCQAYLVRKADRDGAAIVARVTASSEHMRLAMNLGGDLIANARGLAVAAR